MKFSMKRKYVVILGILFLSLMATEAVGDEIEEIIVVGANETLKDLLDVEFKVVSKAKSATGSIIFELKNKTGDFTFEIIENKKTKVSSSKSRSNIDRFLKPKK